MPSVWSWTTIVDLLTYGSTLLLGADAYCGAHTGTSLLSIVLWLDGVHVWVACSH
jgi:hypothetical protein